MHYGSRNDRLTFSSSFLRLFVRFTGMFPRRSIVPQIRLTCTISVVLSVSRFEIPCQTNPQITLRLVLLDPSLSLTVDKEVFECNACIIKPFVPFTKSQVSLVELQPHICGIPSPIVLKVYDPLYQRSRETITLLLNS